MKYMLLDISTHETTLVLMAKDLPSAQLHGKIIKASGRNVIAPPLEGRSFSKLELLPLQYLYWNTLHEAPSDDYSTLLRDCVAHFEKLPIDDTPLQELEAMVARLYPDKPSTTTIPKEPPKDNPSAPKSRSITGRVWEIADGLWQSSGGTMPDRKAVMAACEAEGINPSTASTQYGKWKASRLAPK